MIADTRHSGWSRCERRLAAGGGQNGAHPRGYRGLATSVAPPRAVCAEPSGLPLPAFGVPGIGQREPVQIRFRQPVLLDLRPKCLVPPLPGSTAFAPIAR